VSGLTARSAPANEGAGLADRYGGAVELHAVLDALLGHGPGDAHEAILRHVPLGVIAAARALAQRALGPQTVHEGLRVVLLA
jgi:hypothetical protein